MYDHHRCCCCRLAAPGTTPCGPWDAPLNGTGGFNRLARAQSHAQTCADMRMRTRIAHCCTQCAHCGPQIDRDGGGEVDEAEFVEAIIFAVMSPDEQPHDDPPTRQPSQARAPKLADEAEEAAAADANHGRPESDAPDARAPADLLADALPSKAHSDERAEAEPLAVAARGSELAVAAHPPAHANANGVRSEPSGKPQASAQECGACGAELPTSEYAGVRFCGYCGQRLAVRSRTGGSHYGPRCAVARCQRSRASGPTTTTTTTHTHTHTHTHTLTHTHTATGWCIGSAWLCYAAGATDLGGRIASASICKDAPAIDAVGPRCAP